ncbi:type II toxin-antitoxin system Phd/YefM family antitoxin [Nocardioides stalactiti]|uniref:type II toxin-antitoxin system Phd/YefM family antitoxin n=1 Tax=Nocardioides stalactiti TaxID=2755356 RepID=UPI0016007342|nr:type II toxin-antitoxin system prevent-host-death family antitoxin [Nocardioides stalactiti]
MSVTVNVQEAKTRLSELLKLVEGGEQVVIARAGKPIAELRPVTQIDYVVGGFDVVVGDAFFEPLPEEELVAWEGAGPA